MMGRSEEFHAGREIDLTEKPDIYGPVPTTGSVYLPPAPGAMEFLRRAAEEHKAHVRETKAQGAREQDQQDKAKRSQYGLGGNKALRRHLAEKHELWEEDARDMERPAYFHRRWHTMGEYTPDGHEH